LSTRCRPRPVQPSRSAARTIADLADSERIGTAHVAEALQSRRALAAG
jgi:predicted ATPase with chaperone activity